MPRVLGSNHTMLIQDRLSDTVFHFHYRMPTPSEIISYRNGMTKRVKNKMVDMSAENRLRHGLNILQGITDKEFLVIKDGRQVPLSSDPKSPDYDPDWKKQVHAFASDLIETLAFQVFDASSVVISEDDSGSPDAGDDADPAEGLEGNL